MIEWFNIQILTGFSSDSVLLKHEVAYVMGQMRDPHAIKYLNSVLADVSRDPIVRHEAGEALGAIGHGDSLKVKYFFLYYRNYII